jgi:hypothetical protein
MGDHHQLDLNDQEIYGRYIVFRNSGFFGGKYQIMNFKMQSIELVDLPDTVHSPEILQLKKIVKIIPMKSKEAVIQATTRTSH